MKVKLLVSITGTRNGDDWPAKGGEVDLPKPEAEHMIASGLAVAVESPKVETFTIETAVAPEAPETADAPRTRTTKPKAVKVEAA